MFEAELQLARDAAKIGGQIVNRYFHDGVTLRTGKQSYNLVSDADVESEHAIAAAIHQAFPNHQILGEEAHSGEATAEHLWIVDPLDGTNNFAHGLPHFGVSVAYYQSGRAICGAVLNPVRGDEYWAVRGGGAFFNGEPIHVSAHDKLNQVLVGVGFYYDRGIMMEKTLSAIGDLFREHIHGIRRFGAASLDLCQVACGMYGAFFEYELAPWDFAAGALVLEEAGGKVTTCRGEPLPVRKTPLLCSNTLLHDAVLKIVSANHPPGK